MATGEYWNPVLCEGLTRDQRLRDWDSVLNGNLRRGTAFQPSHRTNALPIPPLLEGECCNLQPKAEVTTLNLHANEGVTACWEAATISRWRSLRSIALSLRSLAQEFSTVPLSTRRDL